MVDLLGTFIRYTPYFKGKWRIQDYWVRHLKPGDIRVVTSPFGVRFKVDMAVPYESMVWLGQEEPRDLARLQGLLKTGDVFVDVGANIGLWTLVAARRVGDAGRVVAFEPNPATFAKLQANLTLNAMQDRVAVHAVAISAGHEPVRFVCRPDHNNSRIAQLGDADATTMVPSAPLTDFVSAGQIAGMKIDVEGYELQVLTAASDILRSDSPWLCVEFNTILAGSNRLGDWPVYTFLIELDYKAYSMHDCRHEIPYGPETRFTGYLNILFQKNVRSFEIR